jgi:hypothetical protein
MNLNQLHLIQSFYNAYIWYVIEIYLNTTIIIKTWRFSSLRHKKILKNPKVILRRGKSKRNRQRSNEKWTKDQTNTTQKTKAWATQTPKHIEGELICSVRVDCFCSCSGTRVCKSYYNPCNKSFMRNGLYYDYDQLNLWHRYSVTFNQRIYTVSKFWLSCIGNFVFMIPNISKLFCFQIFWFWVHLMNISTVWLPDIESTLLHWSHCSLCKTSQCQDKWI